MDVEISALHNNRTWTLVQPNPSMNVLTYKWVFRQKFDESENVERFKAHLVTNGMCQVNGVDVVETFALVIKPASVKLILIFAITWGWELRQYDVSNTVLHGVLKEEVYMRQPLGYKDPDQPTVVYKILRSIYGL